MDTSRSEEKKRAFNLRSKLDEYQKSLEKKYESKAAEQLSAKVGKGYDILCHKSLELMVFAPKVERKLDSDDSTNASQTNTTTRMISEMESNKDLSSIQ
jgi:hypothetical protein